jgi:hypothetical protein
VANDAISDIASELDSIDSTFLQPLANAVQVDLGGADLTNLSMPNLTPPDGTICSQTQVP